MGRKRTQSIYCSVPGCTNFTRARNLCASHYTTLRRREARGCEVEVSTWTPLRREGDPPTLVEATPWMADAACATVDTNVFFPTINTGRPKKGTSSNAYDVAKAVCARCDVRALKTHCPNGHPFDDENTRYASRGYGRVCRTCRAESSRAYRQRLKERAA